MTRACVLLSILLANKRAWPQRPAFMAASRASYSKKYISHLKFHNILLCLFIIRHSKQDFFTFLRPNSSNSRKRSVSLPTFSGTVMKVSDRRESGPAPGSSSARARGSLLKSIKFASFGLLPGSQTERCSFSKRSAMSVPTTVLTTIETKHFSIHTSQQISDHSLTKGIVHFMPD